MYKVNQTHSLSHLLKHTTSTKEGCCITWYLKPYHKITLSQMSVIYLARLFKTFQLHATLEKTHTHTILMVRRILYDKSWSSSDYFYILKTVLTLQNVPCSLTYLSCVLWATISKNYVLWWHNLQIKITQKTKNNLTQLPLINCSDCYSFFSLLVQCSISQIGLFKSCSNELQKIFSLKQHLLLTHFTCLSGCWRPLLYITVLLWNSDLSNSHSLKQY